MRELVGSDIFHLAMESASQPMHTLKVLLIDANTGGATTPETITEWTEKVIPAIPPLRWVLTSRSHWALGAPAWRELPTIEVADHVRHVAVEAPGGREELGRAVATIQMGMLDRGKPLWELWLLTGLQSGRVAHVWKIHHAVADGGACAHILEQAYQHSSEERAEHHGPAPEELCIGDDDMSLAKVMHRHAFRTYHLPAVLKQSRIAVRSSKLLRKTGDFVPQKILASPMTRYNRPLTPARTTAAALLSLEDIKKVRRAFDVTLNDVFVAVCAGAVRAHLTKAGEAPTASLTTSVPVSIRKPEESALYGNRMAFWGLSLGTDIEDPAERLRTIRDSARAAKAVAQRDGAERLLMEWQDYPPLFKALNLFGVMTSKLVGRPPYNMVISNVKGPEEMWADGARVEEIASIGQLTTGLGLNMTGWSYCGAMTIGLVAVPEHEPAIWELADRLEESLAELVAAAELTLASA